MVIQLGKLQGLFRGFQNRSTPFRFSNGAIWTQAEDKGCPACYYEPTARVIAQQGRCFILVEGLNEWVQVVRQHYCDGE